MPVFRARAEFRRRDRATRWVLAGIVIDDDLWPARDGVEPIHGRLPESGLVGWSDIESPIVARDVSAAAAVALDVARATWPDTDRHDVPWAGGSADP